MPRIHWAERKLQAAQERGYFKTADIFAGCGGMSLGFHHADFRCVAAVEIDDVARSSHHANFSALAPEGEYAAHGDITKLDPRLVIQHLLVQPRARVTNAIDILVGGPPCQAFSRLGRAALWDRAGKKHAHAEDNRATLYEHFLVYLATLKPIAFVIENVPEIGRFAHKNIAEEIAVTAEESLGYCTRYALLNAVWYGVPQLRERMFIIGIRRELHITPSFPDRVRDCVVPTGYATSRAGTGHLPVLKPHSRFVDHAAAKDELLPTVTVGEAFQDLPELLHHLAPMNGHRHGRGTNDLPYRDQPSNYGDQMRAWPGFASNGTSVGHTIRFTPRDYEIFRRMRGGDMYPEAVVIAERIFQEKRAAMELECGISIDEGGHEWESLRKATVPPYKITRYPNKFRKMEADKPARTVPAHLGKDCYSHIHYDDGQARTISVREAARLQSFPDAFKLKGSMNQQFSQIGNAVPPLLARAVAEHLRDLLFARIGVQDCRHADIGCVESANGPHAQSAPAPKP